MCVHINLCVFSLVDRAFVVECNYLCFLPSSPWQEVDQQIVIYTKGCVPQFEKWLQDNLTIVAGIFIGIALLQVNIMFPVMSCTEE